MAVGAAMVVGAAVVVVVVVATAVEQEEVVGADARPPQHQYSAAACANVTLPIGTRKKIAEGGMCLTRGENMHDVWGVFLTMVSAWCLEHCKSLV